MNFGELNNYISQTHISQVDNRTTVDESSASALEIENLRKLIPNPHTVAGKIILEHSLMNPYNDVEHIKSRQESIEELSENDKLRSGLERALHRFSTSEKEALESFFGNTIPLYREMNRYGIESMNNLSEKPKSEYLTQLCQGIETMNNSRLHKLSKELACRQGSNGPIAFSDINWLAPALPIVGSFSPIRPLTALASAGGGFAVPYFLSSNAPSDEFQTVGIGLSIMIGFFSGMMGNVIHTSAEKRYVERPLEKYLKDSEESISLRHSIGEIDALISLAKFSKKCKSEGVACQPEILDENSHSIKTYDLVNMVTSANSTNYTPTKEVELENNLHFMTGPNSGGKTTIAKALTHAQILSQLGSYIPASKASVVPADTIVYQVGQNDTATQEEGGYGSQLERTLNILQRITPQSFAIVDDLMDGTDSKSSSRTVKNMFYALGHLGANTLMISHRYDMVTEFSDETNGFGDYIRMQFDNNTPTRQIESGISTDSLGHLVEEKVGADEKGLEKLLHNRGIDKGLYNL